MSHQFKTIGDLINILSELHSEKPKEIDEDKLKQYCQEFLRNLICLNLKPFRPGFLEEYLYDPKFDDEKEDKIASTNEFFTNYQDYDFTGSDNEEKIQKKSCEDFEIINDGSYNITPRENTYKLKDIIESNTQNKSSDPLDEEDFLLSTKFKKEPKHHVKNDHSNNIYTGLKKNSKNHKETRTPVPYGNPIEFLKKKMRHGICELCGKNTDIYGIVNRDNYSSISCCPACFDINYYYPTNNK